MGRLEVARLHLEKVLELNPERRDLYHALADVSFREEKWEETIRWAELGLSSNTFVGRMKDLRDWIASATIELEKEAESV
ncbi:MAG: hypothetical protein VCD00_18235 [Candidatus Hydrogenedentota bacterium]